MGSGVVADGEIRTSPRPRAAESIDAGALVELNQRLATLRATLGFLSLEPREPELRLLHQCFTRGAESVMSWRVWRQDYDLELRRYNGQGWRAMFFLSGFGAFAHCGCWQRMGAKPLGGGAARGRRALRRRQTPEPAPRDWALTDESPR
jgi:hypothetical protein